MQDPAGRLAIVGASLAGLRAAESARSKGWTGSITMIGAEPHLPYDRPPLSKAFLDATIGGAGSEPHPPFREGADLVDGLEVELVLGEPARGIDTRERLLEVGDKELPYDACILATGAAAITIPGSESLRGVHVLRSVDDAHAVRAGLDTAKSVVVVGAGFIGSEVASAARKRGVAATIVEAMPVPLTRSLGEAAGGLCVRLHEEAGTALRLGAGVESFASEAGQVTGVVLGNGEVVPADLVVVGVGARPATTWIAGSGIDLHPRDGGIMCDATLATSTAGVWAAGDVAHFPNALFHDDMMRLEHWTNAAEQGTLAGANVLAEQPKALETVPYFWSDWYGHRLQFVGIPVADEVVMVGPDGPGAIALYRRGDRVVGVFGIDRQRDIMKLRRAIVSKAPWAEAHQTALDIVGAVTVTH